MKLSTQSNISAKMDFINKVINKNIEFSLHKNIQSAIEAVNKIWSRDVIIRNYTSHKLDHNIRVLYFCFELIKTCSIKLNKTGYYILTMAALLHDFGMQCFDLDIIKNYIPNGISLVDCNIEKIVRKNHSRICVDWMKKLYNDSTSESGKLISLIDPRHMQPICEVIKYHSGKELFELKENLVYSDNNVEYKLMPLILILRLADELDIGCERSDNDMTLRSDLEEENLSYFWLHYITQISFVSNNILKIIIETHSADKDKHEFFKEIIYNAFLSKNKSLLDMFESYCDAHLSIEYEARVNDFIDPFNPSIYDYLISKFMINDNYFDNIIDVTYSVPDIGDVFDLDYILLPMLYNGLDHYAVTKEQAYVCAARNPNMTIAAYKHKQLVGYLTLWPVTNQILDKLLNFEIYESDVDFQNDIFSYSAKNKNICWYVSGLGVRNDERGRKNDPMILQQLIEKAIMMVKEVLNPRNIKVERIGAVVYSHTAEYLCLRHFGMNVLKKASYDVDGYIPKAVCVNVKDSSADFIKRIRDAFDS